MSMRTTMIEQLLDGVVEPMRRLRMEATAVRSAGAATSRIGQVSSCSWTETIPARCGLRGTGGLQAHKLCGCGADSLMSWHRPSCWT